jgi:hypothetical protein
MGLTIKKRQMVVGEMYEVLSGGALVGFINREPGAGDKIWQWGLTLGVSGTRVAPSLARAKEGVRLAWDEWLRAAKLAEAEPAPTAELSADAIEADIDAALAEFGGDARATIGALLHDLGTLAHDAQAVVSKGYVRGIAFSSARGRRSG